MKTKFKLITCGCRRCGKQILTGNRSLFGADGAKAKYGRICSDCATEQEVYEMNLEIGQAIVERGINQ